MECREYNNIRQDNPSQHINISDETDILVNMIN